MPLKLIALIIFLFLSCSDHEPSQSKKEVTKKLEISLENLAEKSWPVEVLKKEDKIKLKYSFDQDLVGYLRSLLVKSRSDYIAVSIIDNNTGKVLALVGQSNAEKKIDDSLAVEAKSPAASLAKIITSADLIDNHELELEAKETYRGRRTTLYKYQLKDHGRGRKTTLEKAFAHSNNVIFGKMASKYSSSLSLFKKAEKFYFNKPLPIFFTKTSSSYMPFPEDDYRLAEVASGLNKETMISPLHASYIVSAVANEGVLKPLKIFEVSNKNEEKLAPLRVLKKDSAKELRKMMQEVFVSGTAKRTMRKLKRKIRKDIEVGGKTGRMTGGIPFGTREWLAFYAKPADHIDKGWSVAVMIINEDKWTVKPTFIAKKVLEYYHSNVVSNTKKHASL